MRKYRVDAVFCDDIRQEDNGKHILIGVYPNDIMLPEFPIQVRLSLWARVRDVTPGTRKFRMRLATPRSGGLEHSGELAIDQDGTLIAVFIGMPLSFDAPGEMCAYLSIDGEEEFRLTTLLVKGFQQTNATI